MKYHPRNKPVHGFKVIEHPLHNTWNGMRYRCTDPTNPHYPNYGGRGITVCQEWLDSFETFALDMGLKPSPEHSIDRTDNNKGYCKENCAWRTRTEQALNRRTFKNNKLGQRGVHVTRDGAFQVQCDENHRRYKLGRFRTLEEAIEYREKFLSLLKVDPIEAEKMTERRVRYDAKSGIRGITQNQDGFIVRVTLLDSTRKYLGFSKTLEGAKEKLQAFVDAGGVYK